MYFPSISNRSTIQDRTFSGLKYHHQFRLGRDQTKWGNCQSDEHTVPVRQVSSFAQAIASQHDITDKNAINNESMQGWRMRVVEGFSLPTWQSPLPIGSMYAIYIYMYGNIYHQYTPNVSIYSIHGSYGTWQSPLLIVAGLKLQRNILGTKRISLKGRKSPHLIR